MTTTARTGTRTRRTAEPGATASGKKRGTPSPARNARLEESLEEQVEELEGGLSVGEREDDAEPYDPMADYGLDPLFDDGDPSETGRDNGGWDDVDGAGPEEGGHLSPAPDAIIVPAGAGFTVLISRIRRGLPLPTDKDDEDALVKICREVAARQGEFLRTADESSLVSLTQAQLVAATNVDAERVSRLVKNRVVELPSGEVLALSELLQDPTGARATFIERLLLELDKVDRDLDGCALAVHSLVSKDKIVGRVRQEFGNAGNSEASVRAVMKAHDLPSDPRKRRARYEEGSDWWSS